MTQPPEHDMCNPGPAVLGYAVAHLSPTGRMLALTHASRLDLDAARAEAAEWRKRGTTAAVVELREVTAMGGDD